jgi:pyruvate/2-oxoglutarate dehydrogenase complex dihydrolipoamide acyltransferase (E2) component
MLTKVIIPQLSETSNLAKIIKWYIQESGAVQKGEPLLAVESDKATLDIESPINGFLRKIHIKEGEEAESQQVVAWLTERLDDEIHESEFDYPPEKN